MRGSARGHHPVRRVGALVLAALVSVALAAGCTGEVALEADPATEVAVGARTQEPPDATVLLEGTSPATLALAASQTYFATAGVVVITPPEDAAQLRAASIAMALGLPVLVVGEEGTAEAVTAELERLETHTVLVTSDAEVPQLSPERPYLRAVPAPESIDALQVVIGRDLSGEVPVPDGGDVAAIASAQEPFDWLLVAKSAAATPTATSTAPPGNLADLPGLPPFRSPERLTHNALVSDGGPGQVAALGTARAAGAAVVVTTDLATDPAAIAALFGLAPQHIVGIGDLGDAGEFRYRAQVAATGVELPGGGQELLDGKVYVALRGAPGAPELGSLGEQGIPETLARLSSLAGATSSSSTVVPTAMLLATVASSTPGTDGSYSGKRSLADLRPFVDAARTARTSVLLTFQPGRQSLLEQVRLYEELLLEPNVGVALEPAWRLGPGELPGSQSGVVAASEINEVVDYLAELATARALPPKMLAVRLATGATVSDPENLDASRLPVQVVLEVSGAAVTPAAEPDPAAPEGTVPAPAVTAEQVWEAATAVRWGSGIGKGWWGWSQGASYVPSAELLALDPSPVLITYP